MFEIQGPTDQLSSKDLKTQSKKETEDKSPASGKQDNSKRQSPDCLTGDQALGDCASHPAPLKAQMEDPRQSINDRIDQLHGLQQKKMRIRKSVLVLESQEEQDKFIDTDIKKQETEKATEKT